MKPTTVQIGDTIYMQHSTGMWGSSTENENEKTVGFIPCDNELARVLNHVVDLEDDIRKITEAWGDQIRAQSEAERMHRLDPRPNGDDIEIAIDLCKGCKESFKAWLKPVMTMAVKV